MLRWREKSLIAGHFDVKKGRATATLGFFSSFFSLLRFPIKCVGSVEIKTRLFLAGKRFPEH